MWINIDPRSYINNIPVIVPSGKFKMYWPPSLVITLTGNKSLIGDNSLKREPSLDY